MKESHTIMCTVSLDWEFNLAVDCRERESQQNVLVMSKHCGFRKSNRCASDKQLDFVYDLSVLRGVFSFLIKRQMRGTRKWMADFNDLLLSRYKKVRARLRFQSIAQAMLLTHSEMRYDAQNKISSCWRGNNGKTHLIRFRRWNYYFWL